MATATAVTAAAAAAAAATSVSAAAEDAAPASTTALPSAAVAAAASAGVGEAAEEAAVVAAWAVVCSTMAPPPHEGGVLVVTADTPSAAVAVDRLMAAVAAAGEARLARSAGARRVEADDDSFQIFDTSLIYGELTPGAVVAVVNACARLCRQPTDVASPPRLFVDLGSGAGVPVLMAALTAAFGVAAGVELVPRLHRRAVRAAAVLSAAAGAALHPVQLVCGDFLEGAAAGVPLLPLHACTDMPDELRRCSSSGTPSTVWVSSYAPSPPPATAPTEVSAPWTAADAVLCNGTWFGDDILDPLLALAQHGNPAAGVPPMRAGAVIALTSHRLALDKYPRLEAVPPVPAAVAGAATDDDADIYTLRVRASWESTVAVYFYRVRG